MEIPADSSAGILKAPQSNAAETPVTPPPTFSIEGYHDEEYAEYWLMGRLDLLRDLRKNREKVEMNLLAAIAYSREEDEGLRLLGDISRINRKYRN